MLLEGCWLAVSLKPPMAGPVPLTRKRNKLKDPPPRPTVDRGMEVLLPKALSGDCAFSDRVEDVA